MDSELKAAVESLVAQAKLVERQLRIKVGPGKLNKEEQEAYRNQVESLLKGTEGGITFMTIRKTVGIRTLALQRVLKALGAKKEGSGRGVRYSL